MYAYCARCSLAILYAPVAFMDNSYPAQVVIQLLQMFSFTLTFTSVSIFLCAESRKMVSIKRAFQQDFFRATAHAGNLLVKFVVS